MFFSRSKSANARFDSRRRLSESRQLEGLENRLPMTGNLTFNDAILDNTGGTEGLSGPNAAMVSPDGNHLYSVSGPENAVSVFRRDATSGELTFVEIHRDNVDGVDGLDAPNDVTISPDGRHVYVAAIEDDGLSVFARDPSSGRLTFRQAIKDGVSGAEGLQAANSVVVSPDGRSVYATGGLDHAIAVFRRDTDTGMLSQVEVQLHGGEPDQPALLGASDVIVSGDGRNVYAVAVLTGSINVFSRNQETGALSLSDVVTDQDLLHGTPGVDGMRGPREVTMSPDGQNVYVAATGDNSLVAFTRNGGGGLTFLEFHEDGANGVSGISEGWSLIVSGDNQQLYFASRADSSLVQFNRAADGRLTLADRVIDGVSGADGLTGIVHVALSPDDHHVYLTGHLDHSIGLFDRDADSGRLAFRELQQNEVDMIDGLDGVSSVAVSPDGRSVYTASGNPDNGVSVFLRDSAGLTFMQTLKDGVDGADGLQGASDVTVSPDGRNVYVTSESEDAISVYDRDAHTGILTFSQILRDGVASVEGLDRARSARVTPDGRHVYVTAGSSLTVFRRGGNGQLSFVELHTDRVNGVDGLFAASDLSMSRDGQDIYVIGSSDRAMAIFRRNATTGELTYNGFVRDGVNGVDGLASPQGVDVSPDGKHVYVSSQGDNAVALFDRDETTGNVTFVEVIRNGVDGVVGLDGAQDVTISPDGQHIYVTAGGLFIDDQGVTVFRRDSSSGSLTFLETHQHGEGATEHLRLSREVAVSPDGSQVFVVSSVDDALNIFDRNLAVSGDLDADGELTSHDVDRLCTAIRNNDVHFDLNDDGNVSQDDLQFLVKSLAATNFGDVNFDGVFNSSDLIRVFQSGQYEDALDGNSGWATGDWNCDGDFDTSDLIAAFQDGGYANTAIGE